MPTADIIHEIANGGLGFASLVALIVVIYFQRRDMKEYREDSRMQSTAHISAVNDLRDNVKTNTEITKQIKNSIESHQKFLEQYLSLLSKIKSDA